MGYSLSLLWSFAIIVTYNSSILWLLDVSRTPFTFISEVLVILLALLLLLRPDSIKVLRWSCWIFLLTVALRLPAVPNHRLVLGFISVALGLAGHKATSVDDLAARAGPTLRSMTLIVYLFAALAKMNESFFDPGTSCAVVFFRHSLVTHGFSDITPNLGWLLPWWATVSEVLLIPLLLLRRTRQLGVVLGVLFHLLLATDMLKYFANFTAVMYVLLWSWACEESAAKFKELYNRLPRLALLVLPLVMFGSLVLASKEVLPLWEWAFLRQVPIYIYFMFVLLVAIDGLRVRSPTFGGGPPSRLALPLLALALVNGASPYLGIKTRTGFAMYSNLSIAPEHSNHHFMPPSPDLLGYLRDSVVIERADDPLFAARAIGAGVRYPFIALCAYLDEMDDLAKLEGRGNKVNYLRNGQIHIARVGAPLPEECPPWLARKLFFFEALGGTADRQCIW